MENRGFVPNIVQRARNWMRLPSEEKLPDLAAAAALTQVAAAAEKVFQHRYDAAIMHGISAGVFAYISKTSRDDQNFRQGLSARLDALEKSLGVPEETAVVDTIEPAQSSK